MMIFISLLIAFFCHELGHIIMAAFLGVKLKFRFSLALSLEADYNCQGLRESLVSLAGPLANMLLALMVPKWSSANTLVAIVNLLPILPLDGGRILRGILSKYISWLKLTKFLTGLGLAAGLLIAYLAVAGYLLGGFWWLIFAAYIFYLSYQARIKAAYVLIQALINSQNRGVGKRIVYLSKETNLRDAFYHMSPGWRNLIIVDGRSLDGENLLHNWLRH